LHLRRWDDAAQAHVDAGVSERSRPVRDGFGAAGAFNPAATCEQACWLAAPVLCRIAVYPACVRLLMASAIT
jgi:hypothetical protein